MQRFSLYRVHKVHGRTEPRTHGRTEPQQRYYIPTATRCAGITSYFQEAIQVREYPLTFVVPKLNFLKTRSYQIVFCASTSHMQQRNRYFGSAVYILSNQSISCTYEGDGFSVIIPPVTSYTNYYRFLTPSRPLIWHTFTHHAAVMILCSDRDGIKVDYLSPVITKQETVQVKSLSYCVLYLNITSGHHEITHIRPSVNFGVIIYGFVVGRDGSYAFSGGMKLFP